MASLNDAILKDSIESTEALAKGFSRIGKEYGLALHEAKAFYQRKGQLIKDSNLAELKANAQNAKLSAAERAKWAKQAATVEKQIEMQAATSLVKFKQALYSKYSQAEKVDYQKSVQAKEQSHRKSLQAQYLVDFAEAKASGKRTNEITRKYHEEQIKSIAREREARAAQKAEEKKLNDQINKENQKTAENTKNALKASGKAIGDNIKAGSIKGTLKAVGAAAGATLGTISKLGESSIKDLAANKAADSKKKAEEADANVADITATLESLEGQDSQAANEEREKLEKELAEAKKEAVAANNKATVDAMKAMAASAISDAYDQAFSAAENTMKSYQSHIDARLQGSDKSWKKANNLITNNLGLSTLVKTTNVIEKLKQAVDQGISYNVEQRAFLAEISDKIANTFDAFDASLLRLVKLQQADSTAARLGMEAMLTKFLNSTFEDSSYLTNLADSVAGAIVDASSQLTNAQAAEFDYIVHKWLGALSSVGISDDAVNTIAQGINYLATGDVQNLASNTQLTTMFAMAASRANLEYSQLLLDGLDASTTNKLLESMLSYLADIAKGAENQVVKAAYGNILNLSLSDFKAIDNLSSSISSIASNTASYGSMIAETDAQLSSLITRVSLSEQLSNIYDNAIYSVASDMVNNPITWATQKMLNFMDKNQLDINIPFINAMGFGVDLNTSVKGLMRVGMGLAQGFSFMGTLLSGLASGGGTNLGAWGAKETTSRGSGMSSSTSTTIGATSGSVYVTNTNEADVKNSTLNQATDDAEDTKEITNKNTKSEHTFDDFYLATIGNSATDWVVTHERHLAEVYRARARYLHTRDERMEFIGADKDANNYLAVADPQVYKVLSKKILPEEEDINDNTLGIDTKLGNVILSNGTESKLRVYDAIVDDTIKDYLKKFTFDGNNKLKVATAMDSFFTGLTNMPVAIKDSITLGVSNSYFSKLSNLDEFHYSGEYLKVVDKNSTNSNSISGEVKVSNLPSALSNGALKVQIMNADDIKADLSVEGDMNVSIDMDALKEAFKLAMTEKRNPHSDHTDTSLWGKLNLIYDALITDGVKIKSMYNSNTIPVKENTNITLNRNWNT